MGPLGPVPARAPETHEAAATQPALLPFPRQGATSGGRSQPACGHDLPGAVRHVRPAGGHRTGARRAGRAARLPVVRQRLDLQLHRRGHGALHPPPDHVADDRLRGAPRVLSSAGRPRGGQRRGVLDRFRVEDAAQGSRARGVAVSPVPDRAETLVLGIGNELFTDEGLGVVAARRIADLALPGVEVLDGATLGLALLPEIADRTSVLLLDAVVAGELAPGTVLTLAADQIPMARSIMMSAHQIGVVDALAAAELAGCAPRRLAAVGMVPISLETVSY